MNDAMLAAIKNSLITASVATLIGFLISILIAWKLNESKGLFKNIFETIISLSLFLPPSIVGYILLILLGTNGVIGQPLNNLLGVKIIFTKTAAVIAAFVVALPLIYQCIKVAFNSVEKQYKEAARVMGASEFQIFYKIILPLSMKSILAGTILGFGRAFGEFGATLMIAGNIAYKTQTVPMAMYSAVECGDTATSNLLLIMVIAFSTVLMILYNCIFRRVD